MHPSRWFARPILLMSLLAGVPGPAAGQAVELTLRAVPSGTKISVDLLGSFLARNVMIGETEKNLTTVLRVALIARDKGVVARVESDPVRMEPGRGYSASTWITRPAVFNEALAAPLKPAEFVIFRIGQKTDPRTTSIPRECRSSTHAVLVTLVSAGSVVSDGSLILCFEQGR